MRPVLPSVALLAAAMVVSSCASSSTHGAATASDSVVGVSSPAAGPGSTVQVSSPAAASPSSIPASSSECSVGAGLPTGSTSSPVSGRLFVAGHPTQATLCQYVSFSADGSSPPPPVLVQVAGPTLTTLIASLNALVPTNDVLPCPAPQQTDVLNFRESSNTVQVNVDGGCNFVWSDLGVHAYATNALLQQLASILTRTTRAGAGQSPPLAPRSP